MILFLSFSGFIQAVSNFDRPIETKSQNDTYYGKSFITESQPEFISNFLVIVLKKFRDTILSLSIQVAETNDESYLKSAKRKLSASHSSGTIKDT